MQADGVKKVDVDTDAGTATVTVAKGTDLSTVAASLTGQYSGTVKQ